MTAAVSGQVPLARVTALIVNYNSGRWLERCVATLRRRHSTLPALVVVDNGSTDGSLVGIAEVPNLDLDPAGSNLGFAAGVNRGAARVRTEYLLVINPDCLLVPDALEQLVLELDRHPRAALAAGRVFDTSGIEQRGSRRLLPTPSRVRREVMPLVTTGTMDQTHTPAPESPVEVEAVSGACMLIRRPAFEAVGGMDEAFPMHFEDLDLMARLSKAGWTIRLHPEVIISHAGGISSSTRPVAVLWAKHRGLWRYLCKHCRDQWPAWQRPLWAVLIVLHALLMSPVVWLRRR